MVRIPLRFAKISRVKAENSSEKKGLSHSTNVDRLRLPERLRTPKGREFKLPEGPGNLPEGPDKLPEGPNELPEGLSNLPEG